VPNLGWMVDVPSLQRRTPRLLHELGELCELFICHEAAFLMNAAFLNFFGVEDPLCIIFEKISSSSVKALKFSSQMCCRHSFHSGLSNFGIQRAETLFISKSSCNIFSTVASNIAASKNEEHNF
jgi:hypothetical protein